MEVPGLTPASPVMDVNPVLVTAAAPSTAKLRAVPIGGAVCADALLRQHVASSKPAAIKYEKERLSSVIVLQFPPIHKFCETDGSSTMLGAE